MQTVYLYNTLTRKVGEFKPYNPPEVRMYTCGPTVYHFAHIGNLRTYIMEDVLEKFLNYDGYRVNRVMNITDVGHLTSDADTGEDKMVKGAKREHKTVMEIAQFYADAFFDDCRKLNIKKPDTVEPATHCIPEFIKVISSLMEKGFAYKAGGNVYFDTSKLKNYYVLSNNNEDELQQGVRDDVDIDPNKRNKNDFVLWFTKSKFENQQLKWDSPWGTGYPGWHIECSCISMKHLGEYLDIHCGGVDNIFPHHTNEIAQSESYLGHPWCRYWFHVQHLNDSTGKMSKSNGEFLTVSLLQEKGYDPVCYRFFCLQSHYRKPLLFTYENLDNSVTAYNKLIRKILGVLTEDVVISEETDIKNPGNKVFDIRPADTDTFGKYKEKFTAALAQDLNTSQALTVLYSVFKADTDDQTRAALINDFDRVLSLDLIGNALKLKNEGSGAGDSELTAYVEEKIRERAEAKKSRDFAKADSIRDELKSRGISLKDTREGTEWSVDNA